MIINKSSNCYEYLRDLQQVDRYSLALVLYNEGSILSNTFISIAVSANACRLLNIIHLIQDLKTHSVYNKQISFYVLIFLSVLLLSLGTLCSLQNFGPRIPTQSGTIMQKTFQIGTIVFLYLFFFYYILCSQILLSKLRSQLDLQK